MLYFVNEINDFYFKKFGLLMKDKPKNWISNSN